MKIKMNMNMLDRSLRIAGSIPLIYIGFFNTGIIGNSIIHFLLGSFGILNLLSAIVGFCLVYHMANISSCRSSMSNQN